MTAELLLSVPTLARSAAWPEIKRTLQVEVVLGSERGSVSLVARMTPIGTRMLAFRCVCGRFRRDLYRRGSEIGCRSCLKLPYTSALKTSLWNRQVLLPAVSISRIEQRLAAGGLDRNLRRRLLRRRERLLRAVESALATRRQQMSVDLDLGSSVG